MTFEVWIFFVVAYGGASAAMLNTGALVRSRVEVVATLADKRRRGARLPSSTIGAALVRFLDMIAA